MVLDDCDKVYPDTVLIVYVYVPLSFENDIVKDADDSFVPLNVTDHDVLMAILLLLQL